MVDELPSAGVHGSVDQGEVACLMCNVLVPLAGTTCSLICYQHLWTYVRHTPHLPPEFHAPLDVEYHPWYEAEQDRMDKYADEHELPERWIDYLTD
jgi:hypothetical protein